MLSCLLEVEQAGVDDFLEINVALNGFDDLGTTVELPDGLSDSPLLVCGNEIALVHQNHISKLDLLTQQMENLSSVVGMNIVEFV